MTGAYGDLAAASLPFFGVPVGAHHSSSGAGRGTHTVLGSRGERRQQLTQRLGIVDHGFDGVEERTCGTDHLTRRTLQRIIGVGHLRFSLRWDGASPRPVP